MWENVGIIRAGDTLDKAADTISAWEKCLEKPSDRSSYELNNLVLTGRLVAEAALIEGKAAALTSGLTTPRHRRTG